MERITGRQRAQVSMYVIATNNGKPLGEENALAQRHVIDVTVPPLSKLKNLLDAIDPIRAFLIAIGRSVTAILSGFGIKSWRALTGKQTTSAKPNRLIISVRDASSTGS